MEGFRERLDSIRSRLVAAARRAGRSPESIRLVAVTKTVPVPAIRQAMQEGLTVFGENRVQEARAKAPETGPGAEWHLVGHLQRNKAKEAVRLFRMIHTVDSAALLADLERHAQGREAPLEVLIQANLAREPGKHGALEEEVPAILSAAAGMGCLRVAGLMILPPYDASAENSRRHFRALAELAGRIRREGRPNVEMRELSMGMSEDFEVAVEEGATLIRIGRALFGERAGRAGKENE